MPTIDQFDQIRFLLDFGLVVLIWLVQLIIYPSFLFTDREQFKTWHYRYTGLISLFVIPLMFGQTGIYVALCCLALRWHDIVNVLLVAIAWAATFLLSVPCHDKMQKQGFDRTIILRLINTNWIRTVVWTVVFALDAWMFLRI